MTCSSICDLEFVLLLWSTFCPECGERAPFIHWRGQTSNSLFFRSDGPGLEICQMFQPFTGQVMDDTMMPPDGIHTVATSTSKPLQPTSRRIKAPAIQFPFAGAHLLADPPSAVVACLFLPRPVQVPDVLEHLVVGKRGHEFVHVAGTPAERVFEGVLTCAAHCHRFAPSTPARAGGDWGVHMPRAKFRVTG